ncbi:MAG TPA: hypothetical protein VK625_00210 [Flavitalea sp.]|nr:hypothetical protein [Flavitalea sp.]
MRVNFGFGIIEADKRAIFGRSYAAEPDKLITELARGRSYPGGRHSSFNDTQYIKS